MAKVLGRLNEIVGDITVDAKISNSIFEEVSKQIRKGLVMHSDRPDGFDFSKSDFMMLDSGVQFAPTGQEQGVFYGIDMGGTNVRAIRVVLNGDNKVTAMTEVAMSLENVPYAKHLPKGVLDRNATATELFDGVVHVVKILMEKHGEYDAEAAESGVGPNIREVGFTCSFGINQRSLDSAILTQWSKAIETGLGTSQLQDQVIGRDVCALINEAFARNKINARVNCILNDTISTLISGAFEAGAVSTGEDKVVLPCMIGVIVGTGFNICYYEPEANLYNYVGRVINTECGGFKRAFPRITADALVDFNSSNPGSQIVEKAVSGLYLGEVVRNILIEVLQCDAPARLWQRNVITTQEVAQIFNLNMSESKDSNSGFLNKGAFASSTTHGRSTGEEVNEFNISNVYDSASLQVVKGWLGRKATQEELLVIKKVCDAVVARSARIVGSMLSAFVTKTNHANGVTIGFDGSLYVKNPKYQELVNDTIQQLVGAKITVALSTVHGGSCIGAALLAACTARHSS